MQNLVKSADFGKYNFGNTKGVSDKCLNSAALALTANMYVLLYLHRCFFG